MVCFNLQKNQESVSNLWVTWEDRGKRFHSLLSGLSSPKARHQLAFQDFPPSSFPPGFLDS